VFGPGVPGSSCGLGPFDTCEIHTVRIKPDVVAPGWRIYSTAPWTSTASGTYLCFNAVCVDGYSPNDGKHNYGRGTSFAAPAVSGVAALLIKWFKDQRGSGYQASPSLVKAAMIATADSLRDESSCPGGVCPCVNGDCRPSRDYGWGRVNLDRLTDSTDRFYVTESDQSPLATGESHSWMRNVADGAKDILIALVWSDDNSDSTGAVVNHLSLRVWQGQSCHLWAGNNMHENRLGGDDGYSLDYCGLRIPEIQAEANNVQVVFIPAGTLASGTQVTISASGADVLPSQTQDFSLYAYNVEFAGALK